MNPEQREWLQFFLTIAVILVSVFVAYTKLVSRLTIIEQRVGMMWRTFKLTPFMHTSQEENKEEY